MSKWQPSSKKLSILNWRSSIKFSNTGCGIPQEHIQDRKLFKAFFTTKEKGTGLGLAICNWIVTTHHRGKIEVESKVGIGTTFTIRLPLQQPYV